MRMEKWVRATYESDTESDTEEYDEYDSDLNYEQDEYENTWNLVA